VELGMSVISSTIVGGLTALAFGLAAWRRRKEVDAENLCMQYFGPKYALHLTALFWIGVLTMHMDDPMYLRHPENFYVGLAFIAFSLIASMHFVLYKIALTQDSIERRQWPLKPRRYSLNDLTSIKEKRGQTVLHFRGNDTLTIQLLLSGQIEFIEQLQKRLNAQADSTSSQLYDHHPKA
jgi:hypothetical protein